MINKVSVDFIPGTQFTEAKKEAERVCKALKLDVQFKFNGRVYTSKNL